MVEMIVEGPGIRHDKKSRAKDKKRRGKKKETTSPSLLR